MAKNIKPRVRISPKNPKKGQAFEVKTLVTHDMETGLRKDKATGKPIPRDFLNRLVATYGGKTVMDATWHPSISANPFTSFFVVAGESGPMTFTWTDDKGVDYTKTITVKVG